MDSTDSDSSPKTIAPSGGAYMAGKVTTGRGDVIGRDKQIHGDEVHGDKYELSGDFRNASFRR